MNQTLKVAAAHTASATTSCSNVTDRPTLNDLCESDCVRLRRQRDYNLIGQGRSAIGA
jgi:hypothetical protein